MSTGITVIIIILVIVGIIALVAMGSYNGFIKSRNLIQESWRQIDVELNRRYELIPNLVETVRAYAAHERNTLEDITRLRSQAQQLSQPTGPLPSQQRADVEQALSGAVRNLIVSVEAYPDLKSNQNFLELQKQLTETEDRIAAGRRFYNANVRVYNTKIDSVPSNIIANMFHFEKATYFEVTDPVRPAGSQRELRRDCLSRRPASSRVSSRSSSQHRRFSSGAGRPLPNPQQYQPAPQAQSQQPYGQYGQPQGQQYVQPPTPQQNQGGYPAPAPWPPSNPGTGNPPAAMPNEQRAGGALVSSR